MARHANYEALMPLDEHMFPLGETVWRSYLTEDPVPEDSDRLRVPLRLVNVMGEQRRLTLIISLTRLNRDVGGSYLHALLRQIEARLSPDRHIGEINCS